MRNLLIVTQVAVSFVLLAGAGLMLRTLWKLRQIDPGFKTERVLTSRLDLNFTRYGEREKQLDFHERILARLATEPGVASVALAGRFPLELLATKNDDSMNSTFGYRAGVDQQTSVLEMCAADAGPRGINDGDQVRVFNDRGSVVLKASVNGSVHRGVVRAPSTRWAKRSVNRQSVNALTSERLTDMGEGPTLFACLVEVERCGD